MGGTHIVCTTDFRPESNRGFYHALALALSERAGLTLVHVGTESRDRVPWQSFPGVRDTLVKWRMLEAGSPRAAISERLLESVRKMAMRDEDAALGILDFLTEHRTDLLVMATRAPSGWARLLRGSIAQRVLGAACTDALLLPDGCPDLVDHRSGAFNLRHILLPVSSNPDARSAITLIRTLLHKAAGDPLVVTVLHIGESGTFPSYEFSSTPGIEWRKVERRGELIAVIAAEAERIDADLIVMATAGRRSISDKIFGSTVDQVLRRVRRPLLAAPSE